MRKVCSLTLFFICCLFFITCQKETQENMAEQEQLSKSEILTNIVFEESGKSNLTLKEFESIAKSRNSSAEQIQCGETLYQRYNNDGNNSTGCSSNNSYYNGQDSEFWLYIPTNDTEVSINLIGHSTTKDLDLFIKNYGYTGCLARSTSNTSNEEINVELDQGWYSIFVDGWRGDQTNFDLTVLCKKCENFEDFSSNTRITASSSEWRKQSGYNGDGRISTAEQQSGTKSLFVSNNFGQSTRIFNDFGSRTSGKYKVSFDLFVPSGNNAYMGFTKNNSSNPEQGVRLNFRGARRLSFTSGGSHRNHPDYYYTQNSWIPVEITVTLSEDRNSSWATLAIDGYLLAEWKTSLRSDRRGQYMNSINGLFFHTVFSNSDFYVDNVCIEQLPENILIVGLEAIYDTKYSFITID